MRRLVAWDVLERVDGTINLTREEALFQILDESALATQFREISLMDVCL